MSACHSYQTVSGPPIAIPADNCASSLDDGAGLCCSASRLSVVSDQVGSYKSSLTDLCYGAYARVQCGVQCDPEAAQWWDASLGRAHLCDTLCTDLWSYCYSVAG